MAAVAVFVFAFTALADTEKVGNYTWTYRSYGSDGMAIQGVTPKPTGNLTIPSTLGGKPVTRLEGTALEYSTELVSVKIPASVTYISEDVFDGCEALTSFTVEAGNPAYKSVDGFLLTKDGETLVCGINGDVTIPDGVEVIAESAFCAMQGLTSVTIPDSVTTIVGYAFAYCYSLTSVTIPDGVTTIEDAFKSCSRLAYASLPGHLKGKIDESYVFKSCHPDLVVSYRGIDPEFTIEDGELTDVKLNGATSVTIPANVTRIGDSAFYGCSGLTSVTIPDSVTSIGDRAFSGCSGLTSVTIPASVTGIGSHAFRGCSGLTSFTVGDGNVNYKSVNGLLLSKDGKTLIAGVNGDVTIPDSVTTIGDSAFYGCSGLTSVTIPNSVSWISTWAFDSCSGLMSISVGSGNTNYKSVNGLLLSKDGKTLVHGVNGNVTIPNSVTTIGDSAFYGCSGLTSVTIPNSVTSIWEYAFAYCSSLTSVTIPAGVTSIGDYVFEGCSSLTSVTIPNSVTSIGERVFWNCSGLTSVTIPNSVTSIGSYAFCNCSGLTSVAIPSSVTSIGEGAFCNCSGLTSVTIPAGVTSIGDSVFAYCSSLTSVILPKRFEGNLSEWVFYDCPDGLKITYSGGSYKVTFGKNGGTGGDSYVTATYGAAMPTPRTAPTLSGWTFAGYWDTLALDEKGNAKGKQYYDANMKSVRNWDKESAATLWAKWTNKVTLGKNGGTGGDNYVTCTKGQPMPKRTMPTKTGYVFDGYWTSTGTGGVKYYNADGTSARAWDKGGSVTLWAKWVAAAQVKVTFGKNGGTGGDSYVTATTGKPMPTPRTAPTLKGWSFGGYWDTLACDAKGNPLGKQYYNSKMESVRNWDKTTATTLWAKWTVKVTLGKNGGTGGDSYVTVIKGQPFPKRTMPTKSGYTFGGYFVSASTKTGQCYNPDGTGTASMKWSTGGTPTIWALWTKTSSCVELPAPVALRASSAAPSASAASAVPESATVPAGLCSGVLADGSGAFWLMLDEPVEGFDRTAYLYVASEDGSLTAECTVEESDGILILTMEDGETFAVDPVAGTAFCNLLQALSAR